MKRILLCFIEFLLVLIGICLTLAGAWLSYLGGTPYYLVTGIIYIIAGILIYKQKNWGLYLTYVVVVYTIIWALYERGTAFWPMLARIMVPLGIAIVCSLIFPKKTPQVKKVAYSLGGLSTVFFVAMLVGLFIPHEAKYGTNDHFKAHPVSEQPENWVAYGKTAAGNRFSSFTQINRDNVKDLQIAWTYHSGDSGPGIDQNTPLQIDNLVYTCSRNNHIAALDVDSGQPVWTFDPEASSPMWQRCRSVSYYKVPEVTSSPLANSCQERIIATTIDARLIALDTKTGKLCDDFGDHGTVNLKDSMGPIKPGFYFQTSSPLVARDVIVIGGWVVDNQETNEPSGVIRAFNANTGELEWAWDLGNPSITKYPPEGETYTLETPNMWTHAAYDDELGLIYLPLGNTTPDYYGANRPAFSDEYNDTLVALDVTTGRERWKFQTVHHDIWDYDLPSQPALVNVPDDEGNIVPALIQTTKRGQIFLLNRATGEPVAQVEEKAVPSKSNIPGEYVSPTQPYSVGMPTIGAQRLTEDSMWGMTMFDQLACRIQFKQATYEGDFTPIDFNPTIEQPGNLGGFNWGSVSVDPLNNMAYVNDIRIPSMFWLVERDDYSTVTQKYKSDGTGHGPSPQRGTPYGLVTMMWMSALGVPCSEPPFGTITAIDLTSREVAWQVPAGTAEQLGPFGLKSHLPMPIGVPTYAGTMTTAGGLVFFAGSQDYYIRAYNSATGEEVWKYPLPIGSSATPMTYISPTTGQQYVVISVGGAAHSDQVGDYVIAFSLPKAADK
ncbi:membrane-bound PQQ-dependent dehydrogenase, glucose/quinate/shikimate family [Zophobihabitans entericus]|uniref:Membrane-bound PQQ-dependent dehydrogenase, glucose/quinate/shikimate family n=1 Tax=Zophobihabitans entericus TaxID=1635327 RepID=A0A6G9I9N9_9GAMM|nr:membrane-bound PQQ-dependent dehydrogenase, glucose/quinate/shikimate family [Zophobihabitans entericus]QIQ20542.1 membrane-bound PQQ-dependent dehydrogenase, glucose/quinate/shikimate family [Zophobihabitans entericus]